MQPPVKWFSFINNQVFRNFKYMEELLLGQVRGVPTKIANPLVVKERTPWKFPRGVPFGPPKEPDAAQGKQTLADRLIPDDAQALDDYAADLHELMEDELAQAYAISKDTTPRFFGRNKTPSTVKQRAIPASNGNSASTLLPHVLRLAATKIATYARLSRLEQLTVQQFNELSALRVRLPRIVKPPSGPCPAWIQWQTLTTRGLHSCEQCELTKAAGALRKAAANTEAASARARKCAHEAWTRRLARNGDAAVHSWVQVNDGFGEAHLPSEGWGQRSEDLGKKATPLTDVWRKCDDDAIEQLERMRSWCREANLRDDQLLSFMPDTDGLKDCSKSFPWKKAFGSEGIHPRHLALLSDQCLLAIIQLYLAMLSNRSCPRLLV